MSLTVNDFRASSAEFGKAALQTNEQQASLVKGGIGDWIKSLLNIGGARATNARTLDALRQAVQNDPQYARVTSYAGALLGRMSVSSPLTGKQVGQFLAQMDTAAAKADAQAINNNKHLVSSMAIEEMSKLNQYVANAVGHWGITQTPEDMKELNSLISDRILARVEASQNPLGFQDIRAIFFEVTNGLAPLQHHLNSREDLPQDMKNFLKGEFFQNGAFITTQKLDELIQFRLNMQANQELQQSLSDISSPDAPLRKALTWAITNAAAAGTPLEPFEIKASINDKTLASLAKAVESDIDKASELGQRTVSLEEGKAFIAARVKNFIDAYAIAGTLGTPKESAFFKDLALNSPVSVTPAYLQALAKRAGDIPKEAFMALGNASTSPKKFLAAVENLGKILERGFATLDKAAKLEGPAGHQSYLNHCLNLALIHSGLSSANARTLFTQLNMSMATDMRDMFSFGTMKYPAMASNSFIITRLMESFGRMAGIDLDDFMEKEALRPVPQSASEFIYEVRALLPDSGS